RGLRAVEQAQEFVAAELPVRAEEEEGLGEVTDRARVGLGGHLGERPDREHRLRIEPAGELVVRPVAEEVGRDRSADEPDQDDERDVDAAGDRELVAAEPDPHALPVATGAYRTFGT